MVTQSTIIIENPDENEAGNEEFTVVNFSDFFTFEKVDVLWYFKLLLNAAIPFAIILIFTLLTLNYTIKTTQSKMENLIFPLIGFSFLLSSLFTLKTKFPIFNLKNVFASFIILLCDFIVIYFGLNIFLQNSFNFLMAVGLSILSCLNFIYASEECDMFSNLIIFIMGMILSLKLESFEIAGGEVDVMNVDSYLKNNCSTKHTLVLGLMIPLRCGIFRKIRAEEDTKNFPIFHGFFSFLFYSIFSVLKLEETKKQLLICKENIIPVVLCFVLILITCSYFTILYNYIKQQSFLLAMTLIAIGLWICFYFEIFNQYLLRGLFERVTIMMFIPIILGYLFATFSMKGVSAEGNTLFSNEIFNSLFGNIE